jgi:succinate dehydrogenase / fumarate reductase cytochrome b subunit
MGITGLLLCGFLVTHLAGNMLMNVSPTANNNYAHALHGQEWLVVIAEIGLLILFLLHLWLAFDLTRMNRQARQVSYEQKKTKEGAELAPARADTWMLISGMVVLGFLIVHLADFHFEASPDIAYKTESGEHKEPFDKAIAVLKNPIRAVVYVAGTIFLAFHLSHGFSSAFRSLGISHPKYNQLIRNLGYLFAVIFGLGFATFPIWANGFK